MTDLISKRPIYKLQFHYIYVNNIKSIFDAIIRKIDACKYLIFNYKILIKANNYSGNEALVWTSENINSRGSTKESYCREREGAMWALTNFAKRLSHPPRPAVMRHAIHRRQLRQRYKRFKSYLHSNKKINLNVASISIIISNLFVSNKRNWNKLGSQNSANPPSDTQSKSLSKTSRI